jgi:hypothetical protein
MDVLIGFIVFIFCLGGFYFYRLEVKNADKEMMQRSREQEAYANGYSAAVNNIKESFECNFSHRDLIVPRNVMVLVLKELRAYYRDKDDISSRLKWTKGYIHKLQTEMSLIKKEKARRL